MTGAKRTCGRRVAHLAAAVLAGVSLAEAADAQPVSAPLALDEGFQTPPPSARPRVWWHWMNGNVTSDGVRKDLEWMARVRLGGVQNFEVSLSTPQVVERRLVFETPEWKATVQEAAKTSDRLGLELAISSTPGFSETGGPWVAPTDGMKKLVWSETLVAGGRRFQGVLQGPPQTTGAFQDISGGGDPFGGLKTEKRVVYGDAAVIAYRLPRAAVALTPKISDSAAPEADLSRVADGLYATDVTVTGPLLLEFAKPVTVRGASLALAPSTPSNAVLEVEEPSGGWRKAGVIESGPAPQTTVSFPAVTGRRFRLSFTPAKPGDPLPIFRLGAPGAQVTTIGPPRPRTRFNVRELRLFAEPRVHRFEAKAGFGVAEDYFQLDDDAPAEAGVDPASVIDLTSRMTPDGRLDWTPPAGQWRVLRLGYSLLGAANHPAPAEATGLEVDKYDGDAVRRYMDAYLGIYADAVGSDLIGKKGIRALVADSTEIGPANWTPGMLAQFQRLRGYDPRPWLPALTGVVVGSQARSTAFLYDFRRTLADLHASEHYGVMAEAARARGLTVYAESHEGHRMALGDDLAMRSHADVPMAALWTWRPEDGPRPGYLGDMKGAASVAHVYGQNLVAAEALTSVNFPWAYGPGDLKPFIDLAFAFGVNRPVIHTSVHQPVDDKVPGLSMMVFGQYFNRHETWAEMAGPWVDYIARSSFLLQQGRDAADVAYFYGEEAPAGLLYAEGRLPGLPQRYAYDLINADMLLEKLAVQDGRIVAASGASYRAIYLGGESARMTLPVLKRLARLAEDGALIVGRAPQMSPGLNDDPAEFSGLVQRLWAGGAETRVGKGKVVASADAEAALGAEGLVPDFTVDRPDAEVLFVHRKLADGDLYYVNNRKKRPEQLVARFRTAGRAPEIWRAATGTVEPVSYRTEGAITAVPLDLQANDAVFVVFRKPTATPAASFAKPEWRAAGTISQPWRVSFQPRRGAPTEIVLPQLSSLSESGDPGIKYFSGVATYRTRFQLPAGVPPGQPLRLDLGQIGDVAEVRINDMPVGTVWTTPHQVDISRAVRRGRNKLEIRVANLWVNRLIGDAQPGADKITFTTRATYRADAPLRQSGLIGPVALWTQ